MVKATKPTKFIIQTLYTKLVISATKLLAHALLKCYFFIQFSAVVCSVISSTVDKTQTLIRALLAFLTSYAFAYFAFVICGYFI